MKLQHRPLPYIYYLDETWVIDSYTVEKVWQDRNILCSRQAFLEAWSTGIKPQSGKGKRLITHIGSVDGFVEGGLLMFQSNPTGDYHEEMNGDVFEEYFEQILHLIPPNSVMRVITLEKLKKYQLILGQKQKLSSGLYRVGRLFWKTTLSQKLEKIEQKVKYKSYFW